MGLNAASSRPVARTLSWRFLTRFVGVQLAVLLILLVACRLSVRDVLGVAAAFLAISAWMGHRVEEFVELESTLRSIRTDLEQKTEALSKEREELATLMSGISDAILAVDGDGRPLFFNSRFAVSFFEPGRSRTAREQPHLGEIFRLPDVLKAFQVALKEGQPRVVEVALHIRTEALPHYFSLAVAPLRRDSGPVYGAIGIFHDVTELKRAEKIRIEFVSNVSHELRTPLTAIKGYTDTLKDDFSKNRYDGAGRFLDVISRNVDRLMSLIGDLLDLSSLESQDASRSLDRVVLGTRDLTERVMAQLEPRRAEKRHRFETVIEAETVQADAARIEQVLVNLLENAIKYLPPEGRIRVRWEKSRQGVLLHVSDNGPGIPVEHHARLFERFYRVEQARSRELGGTGLGLAIVKHIMQQHGGSVWVVSEVGKGAEFVCQFPVLA